MTRDPDFTKNTYQALHFLTFSNVCYSFYGVLSGTRHCLPRLDGRTIVDARLDGGQLTATVERDGHYVTEVVHGQTLPPARVTR